MKKRNKRYGLRDGFVPTHAQLKNAPPLSEEALAYFDEDWVEYMCKNFNISMQEELLKKSSMSDDEIANLFSQAHMFNGNFENHLKAKISYVYKIIYDKARWGWNDNSLKITEAYYNNPNDRMSAAEHLRNIGIAGYSQSEINNWDAYWQMQRAGNNTNISTSTTTSTGSVSPFSNWDGMIQNIDGLGNQVMRNVAISGLVGTGAGITTGVLCRKKFKKGWGSTILFSVLASGVASGTTYTILSLQTIKKVQNDFSIK